MKIILVTLLLITGAGSDLRAQKQDEKSITQHILQIAANKVHLEYIKKGYRIVRDGLNTISSFKDGEYKLHDLFFKSLKAVNPAVKRYWKVEQAIVLQKQINAECNRLRKLAAEFSDAEQQYITQVAGRVLKDSDFLLGELLRVTSANQLQMKDDERMSRIDKLYLAMQEAHSFCKSFCSETALLATARAREENDVKTGRELHGLNAENL